MPRFVGCWGHEGRRGRVSAALFGADRCRSEPSNIVLDEKLGGGESAAIALAIEIEADALLIDERDGTRIANRLGMATVGTLGILSMAAEKKLLSLEKAFAALQQTSFRVRSSLLTAILTHHQHRGAHDG